jgi:DEAD/DEAH box helicase domain-containing protein
LQQADLIVGFNIIGFDYSVLRGYTRFDFKQLNTLDMLRDIHARLRYRVSLDALGRATLNTPKSADGLQALQWFKEGRMDLIETYCQNDVEVTRNLFQYGLDNGYLIFDRKGEGRMRIPLDWDLTALAGQKGEKSC